MKYLLLLLVLFFLSSSCNTGQSDSSAEPNKTYQALTPEKYDAVNLNNQVSNIQIGSVKLVESVFKSDTLNMDQERSDAVFDLEVSISRLQSLGEEHQMAAYFSNSVITLLRFYKQKFEGDFSEVIRVLKKKEIEDGDRLFLDEYDQSFADQEALLFQDILVRQDSFANYFGIQLTD